MTNPLFKPILTTSAKLASVAVVDGQIIAVTDTGELYVDRTGARQKYSDIVIDTYQHIISTLAPYTGKLYFAYDTHQLLQYSDGSWQVLNSGGGGGGDGGGTYVYGSPQALVTRANLGVGSVTINDNLRGYASVDFQAQRLDENDFAKGDFSFLYGQNSANVAENAYAFGSGTRFDVAGAIQTNQNITGNNGWQGHTGIIGKSFEWNGDYNLEIFKVNTGTIALFDIDVIVVSSNGLTLSKYQIAVYRGQLMYTYNWSPVCQFSPLLYLSDNKMYMGVYQFDVMQLGIRYTILGTVEDEGDLS